MKRLLSLALLFLVTAPFAFAQKYVDFVGGSDTYDGTNKTHTSGTIGPWKSSPYMQSGAGCSDNGGTHFGYTHSAGQVIDLKGGVTWPAACFPMTITAGGSSDSVRDTYGVDQTWFTGGSFTMPKFDAAGAVLGMMVGINVSNITMSTLDIGNPTFNGSGGGFGGACNAGSALIHVASSAQNITVSNSLLHDWRVPSPISPANHAVTAMCDDFFANGGSHNVVLIDSEVRDDGAGNAHYFGTCGRAIAIVRTHCHFLSEGIVSEITVHDSEFDHLTGYGSLENPLGVLHTNTIETDTGGSGDGPIYNNVIHENATEATIITAFSISIFNNIVWKVYNRGILCTAGQTGSTSDLCQMYNNTSDTSLAPPGLGSCPGSIEAGSPYCTGTFSPIGYTLNGHPTTMTINIKNNHAISAVGVFYCDGCTLGAAGSVVTNNVAMNTTQATTQGYTSATTPPYRAFPVSQPTTVLAGVNLSPSCVVLPALCSDVEGSKPIGLTAVPRPTGTTAWDGGAYQSPGSGGGTPPTVTVTSPAAGTISGTVTITVTASGGTISSIQPQVDGVPFGNACTASPCNALWDTTKVGNGSHTVGGTATNGTGQGTATPVSVTVNNSTPGCLTSAATWTNTSITTQTGSFTFSYTIQPTAIPPVGSGGPVWTVSEIANSLFASNPVLVRQSENGFWEAYDGLLPGYNHTGSVSWIVGTTATVNGSVDFVNAKYTIQITQNGVNTTIATNYGFRTTAASFGFWNLSPAIGSDSLIVCNFALGATGALTPTSFNFGTVNVGQAPTQVFTLTNNGGSPLTLTAYNISPSVFTISSNTCSSPLASGANCLITVAFTPTAPTSYSGTLSITNSGTINTVTLTGLGSSLSAPSAPGTPTATVGGSSITLNYTASTGTGPITYNVQRSTVTGGPYATIATGVTTTTYTDPGLASGTYYYVVSATNPGGTSPNSGQASATISTAPQTNLSPATLNFGNIRLGGAGSLNETVSNVGTANLTLSCTVGVGITISGANAADFAVTTNGCASPVVPNSSFSLLITFTPSTTGIVEQASLSIISNAGTSPDSVVMNGTGVAPLTITPTSLSFGNIYPTKTSAAQNVTVTNQSGATVNFSSIALGGANPGEFAISSDGCSPSVANGGNCVVSVTFSPTGNGQKNATLIFTDDAAGSPQSVTLVGKGNPHVIKAGIAF